MKPEELIAKIKKQNEDDLKEDLHEFLDLLVLGTNVFEYKNGWVHNSKSSSLYNRGKGFNRLERNDFRIYNELVRLGYNIKKTVSGDSVTYTVILT